MTPPPDQVWKEMARRISERLKLHLFNYDVIIPAADPTQLHLIDINYFPGYEKLAGYEDLMVDFFQDIVGDFVAE